MDGLILILALGAYLTSTVSGVIGMAGGTMLLGIMMVAGLDPVVAVPIHAVVQLVSNATRVQAFLQHVRWGPFLTVALVASPGPVLGLWLVKQLDADAIRLLMGCVILYATWAPKWGLKDLSERVAFALAGAVGGVLGVVVGAVGPLIAPFFLRGGFAKEQIIATKASCQAYLHVIKIVAFGFTGFSFSEQARLFVPMALATVAGTYTGRWLLGKLPDRFFFWFYKVVLTLLALRLILRATGRM